MWYRLVFVNFILLSELWPPFKPEKPAKSIYSCANLFQSTLLIAHNLM